MISDEERKERLLHAKKHIFSMGVGDIASSLCHANMAYGIAKIHWAQEKIGMKPNATFIGGPDETITRNVTRWQSGFGYGGKISWGDGSDKVIILDVMPNACGILIGGLEKLPTSEDVIRKVHELSVTEVYIDNILVEWDFAVSNYFIDLFKVVETSENLPPYIFVIHSGTSELKADNSKGSGLYYYKSKTLQENATTITTPFGELHLLSDIDADTYWQFYKYADSFAKKRRAIAAQKLFDDYMEISNTTHQGLLNYNEVLLGSNSTLEKCLLPLVLRSDLPAYLFRGKPNLTDDTIEVLGFVKRAEKLGVYNRLKNANLLPHGSGYTLYNLLTVVKVTDIAERRYFTVDMQGAVGQKVIENPQHIPYGYRGREVVVRTLELELGDIAAHLVPEYVIKV